MRAWKEGGNFHEMVLNDPDISGRVPKKQLEKAFDQRRQLRNVDKIFARVFGEEGRPKAAGKKLAKAKR
jgi:adenylosuccinate lyase